MNQRIRTLDGIRGIAITMVLVGHTCQNYHLLDAATRRWAQAFANPGLGVRLFFVLSGYLITQLLIQEQAKTGTISLPRFYWRRALRIFPAFYVYLMAMTLLQNWIPVGVTPQTWIAAATYTWNYSPFWVTSPPEGTWALGHFWTLALEQQFYLFWPVALLWLGQRRGLWLTLALVAWCPAARAATYFLFPDQRGLVGIMFHTGIDSLMIGCAAALLLTSETNRERLRTWGARGMWVACIWALVLSPVMGELVRGSPLVIGLTLDGLAAAWVVAWVHHSPGRLTEALLGRGLWPMLGAISYSLYLWQQIFLSPTGAVPEGRIVLPLLGAVAAATASYWLVEKPLLRLKNRPPSAAPVRSAAPAETS